MDELARLRQENALLHQQLQQSGANTDRMLHAKNSELNHLRQEREASVLNQLGQTQDPTLDSSENWWDLFSPKNANPTQTQQTAAQPQLNVTQQADQTFGPNFLKQLKGVVERTAAQAVEKVLDNRTKAYETAVSTQQQLQAKFAEEEKDLANNPHLVPIVQETFKLYQQAYPNKDPQELYREAVAKSKQVIGQVKTALSPKPQNDPYGFDYPAGNASGVVNINHAVPVVTEVSTGEDPRWVESIQNHNKVRNNWFS